MPPDAPAPTRFPAPMCDDVVSASSTIAPIPAGPDGPVFAEPWQASAFGLAVALNERGVFGWSEWAETLGGVLRERGAAAAGEGGYWSAWVAALERVLAKKGLAGADAIDARTEAWRRAAAATPHGVAIRLENDPRARAGSRR